MSFSNCHSLFFIVDVGMLGFFASGTSEVNGKIPEVFSSW
jgi:hypothetical protein